MTKSEDIHATWRTASHTGETCVEVRVSDPVKVRDTKDRDRGVLTVEPQAWAMFLNGAMEVQV